MATYAVGDIQGCFTELEHLLQIIEFDQHIDQLWLVGDLVNRGPQSLETIQFVKSLGDSAQCVLGNHDIHLIASYVGVQPCKPKCSLRPILDSPDVVEIIEEESTEDIYQASGINIEEIDEKGLLIGSPMNAVKARMPWLMITVIGQLMAASCARI